MNKIFKKIINSSSSHLEYFFGVLLVMLVASAFLFVGVEYVKNINKQNSVAIGEKANFIHTTFSSFIMPDLNPEKIASAIDGVSKGNSEIKNLYIIAEYNDVDGRRFDVVGTLNRYEVGMGSYKPIGLTESLMDYVVAGGMVAKQSYASGTQKILKTVSLIRNDNGDPARIYIVSDVAYPVAMFTDAKSLKVTFAVSLAILFIVILLIIKYLVYISNKNHLYEKNRDRNNLILFAFREVRTSIKNIGNKIEKISDTERLSIEGNRSALSVRAETQDLSSLISNIVDTHNIEEGRMTFHYSIVNPNDILEDVCRIMSVEAKIKNLKLSCLSANIPNIKVDRIRFKQIIQNLVHNAIKYTDKGSVTISSRIIENGKFVEIRVSDTGIGINQEKQKKLFSKFFKENNDEIRGVKSAGLGLFLTSELTQKMSGTISFESKEGVGSDFVLKFKVEK